MRKLVAVLHWQISGNIQRWTRHYSDETTHFQSTFPTKSKAEKNTCRLLIVYPLNGTLEIPFNAHKSRDKNTNATERKSWHVYGDKRNLCLVAPVLIFLRTKRLTHTTGSRIPCADKHSVNDAWWRKNWLWHSVDRCDSSNLFDQESIVARRRHTITHSLTSQGRLTNTVAPFET